jgi:hypothetical protein
MNRVIFCGLFLCLTVRPVSAGDAIAIGYNYDGVWTAVTYNRSSTPKGGAHYRSGVEACTFALRDLRVRASEDLARTKIIGQSDRTGFVAVVRGHEVERNQDATAIGRGHSQKEADENALNKLNEVGATASLEIVYRYFSYGDNSAEQRHSKVKMAHYHRPS